MEEVAKQRCKTTAQRIHNLPLSKITDSCKRTLLRLVNSELNFLSRLSSTSPPLSCNIGHIEAIVHILEQPSITGVSRVSKPIPLSSTSDNVSQSKSVHVDIVCTLNKTPVWFIVSDRNPNYISWNDSHGSRGMKSRIGQVLDGAESSFILQPSSIIVFFASGIDKSVQDKLMTEFGFSEFELKMKPFDTDSFLTEELEGEWVNVHSRTYNKACIMSVKVGQYQPYASAPGDDCNQEGRCVLRGDVALNEEQLNVGISFQSLISQLKDHSKKVEDMIFSRGDSVHEEL